MLYGLNLLMKKRASVKTKRRVSSRKPVSRTEISWFDSLKDVVNRRREFVFLLLILAAGMLIFDIIGYDYTGLVIENNAVSGAQSAGIPDSAIASIASTFRSIFELIFGGFLDPILTIFSDNQEIATRLTLFFILFFFIAPVTRKILSKDETHSKAPGTIVAILISLLSVALLPASIITRIKETIPTMLIIGYLVGAVYPLLRWKVTDRVQCGLKAVLALAELMILSYIMTALTSDPSGAAWLVAGFGFLTLAGIFFYEVYRVFAGVGEGRSHSERAEERAESRRDRNRAGEIHSRTEEETVASEVNRTAPREIRQAEAVVYDFMRSRMNSLGRTRYSRGVRNSLNRAIDLLRNSNNRVISVEVANLTRLLREFEELCEIVYATRSAPLAAHIARGTPILTQARVSLNRAYRALP